jgi:hypothetical protein
MKKAYLIIVLSMILTITFCTSCFAGWLIYHKPAFKGKIVDAETKKPIEGAVVVAMYKKYPIISGPGGGSASIMHIKEALTDKKGEFHISSYTTFIQPLFIEGIPFSLLWARIIVFKRIRHKGPDTSENKDCLHNLRCG